MASRPQPLDLARALGEVIDDARVLSMIVSKAMLQSPPDLFRLIGKLPPLFVIGADVLGDHGRLAQLALQAG
ncbi:MAG: hypothetical protein AB7K64_22880 [Variibacter sp.]